MRLIQVARLVVVAGLALSAASALAQPIETLTYSIEWENDVSPGNPTAIGAVWAKITPEIGTKVHWNPGGGGTGQVGILKAFASSIFDVLNTNNGSAGMLAWTVPEEFNVVMLPGMPDGNGGIKATNAGQFGKPTNPNPNTDQKVKLLDLAWTTTDFSPKFVEYKTNATSAKVYLDVGLAAWVGEKAMKVDGKGGFNVVPSPGAVVVCVIALFGVSRRRRNGGA